MDNKLHKYTGASINKRFTDGLKNLHGLGMSDLDNYAYAGGNSPKRIKYYELKCETNITPPCVCNCICGQEIKENCYIKNIETDHILILGSCCIKRFVPKSYRTCSDCGVVHRNRVIDKCNDCKWITCNICNTKRYNEKNSVCRECVTAVCIDCGSIHRNRSVNRCNECRELKCDICGIKKRNTKYRICYSCYIGDQNCEDCGAVHTNGIVNVCENCRMIRCETYIN